MKLVLLRHGESEANFQNYWTGWLDVALTEKGMQQATEAGRKMNEQGLVFDIVYTSVLKRAIKMSQLALEEMNQLYLPVQKTWRLNERHYGALVGKNVLVVGHGNSLRALTKYLEDVPENQLDTIDIPNAQPIQYTLNKELEILGKELL